MTDPDRLAAEHAKRAAAFRARNTDRATIAFPDRLQRAQAKAEWLSCPDCGARYTAGAFGETDCPECATVERAPTRRELLARCGVPRAFRRPFELARVPAVARPRVRELLEAWPSEPSILLAGANGAGKSMAAAELLYRHGGGRWVLAADLVDARFRGQDAYGQALRARQLVVDDVGAGYSGEGWSAVEHLVVARTAELRRTIYTAAMPLRLIAERHSSSIADRLAAGAVVDFGEESQR